MNISTSPPAHLSWLKKRTQSYKTADGKVIDVWDFVHSNQPAALSAWASHFRNHYFLDEHIDHLRGKKSRAEFLNDFKFPTETEGLGPSIRAGDFGEILVADFLQWIRGYWVPRVRWGSKVIRNESPKGSDVVGFHVGGRNAFSNQDTLAVFETKTKFSASKKNKLQEAINDSAKDHVRLAESLNFIKQKLFERGDIADMPTVERFQNPADLPYQEVYGAAEILSTEFEQAEEFSESTSLEIPIKAGSTTCKPHPNRGDLQIIVISGMSMMQLVHKLYKLAADEA